MAQNNTLASVIAAAKSQAEAPAPSVPAVAGSRPAPMTLQDFSQGSMSVDEFIKVKEHGLLIGTNHELISRLRVAIDMTEIQVCDAIKFGNPPTYYKTYDGITCTAGGSWDQAKAKAVSIDPNARPYKSADIPCTLLEDAKDISGKKTVAEAGIRLGHSLSTTNKANFQEFLKEVGAQNLLSGVVEVALTAEAKSNKAGNRWGVLAFELIGEKAPDQAEAA